MSVAAPPAVTYDYDRAVSRNIGWLSEWEQVQLRHARVAIAGMGGVGGAHMLTLARLGVGAFSIADFDCFELANLNRQAGATVPTLGQPKVDAVADMALAINPTLDIRRFPAGVSEADLDAFLDGCSVYIDGLDIFVLELRRALFARARARGITAITAAPLGFGVGYVIFTPNSMSFEQFFALGSQTPDDQAIRFILGLAPAGLHRAALTDPSRVDLGGKRGPSTAAACQLCAGVAATEAVKLLIGRGRIRPTPWFHQFDPFVGRFISRRLVGGAMNPVQRLRQRLTSALAARLSKDARPLEVDLPDTATRMERVLDVARWAPSPDNSQPWRFEILDATSVRVHLDFENGNPYAFNGAQPQALAGGMLLKAMSLAASRFGCTILWQIEAEEATGARLLVTLQETANAPDPLADYLPVRSVWRGPLSTRRLGADDKARLEQALGPGFVLEWHEGIRAKARLSWLSAAATRLRLASSRCHDVHKAMITPQGPFSRTGLPARALGLDPLTRQLMLWTLPDHRRMVALNRLGAGLWAGLEMDLLPGLACGAHVVIRRVGEGGSSLADRLVEGERLLTFWLQATQCGLRLQPTLGPLFASRVEALEPDLASVRKDIAARYADKMGGIETLVFQARLGYHQGACRSRSLRHVLTDLSWRGAETEK